MTHLVSAKTLAPHNRLEPHSYAGNHAGAFRWVALFVCHIGGIAILLLPISTDIGRKLTGDLMAYTQTEAERIEPFADAELFDFCLLYTSPSPRD